MGGLLGSAERIELVAMFLLGASVTAAAGLAVLGVGLGDLETFLAALYPTAYLGVAGVLLIGAGAVLARQAMAG